MKDLQIIENNMRIKRVNALIAIISSNHNLNLAKYAIKGVNATFRLGVHPYIRRWVFLIFIERYKFSLIFYRFTS